jgi:hypothetical protein
LLALLGAQYIYHISRIRVTDGIERKMQREWGNIQKMFLENLSQSLKSYKDRRETWDMHVMVSDICGCDARK